MLYAGPKLEDAAGTDAFTPGGGSGDGKNLSVFRQIRALDATARYLLPMTVLPSTGTPVALVAGRIYYMPFDAEIMTDGLACEVTTAGAAGSMARMAIYTCGSNGLPDQLIVEGTPVSIATTGLKVVAISPPIRVNQACWVALTISAAASFRTGVIDPAGVKRATGQVNLTGNGSSYGVQRSSGSYAALPSTAAYDFDYTDRLTLGIRGAV
jgi:hypothetical protein